MSKPVIDKECCTNCGVCAALASEVFQENEDGEVMVVEMESYDDFADEIDQAIDSCPDSCISIKSDED